jgi:hypothetical protein
MGLPEPLNSGKSVGAEAAVSLLAIRRLRKHEVTSG